MVPPEAVPLITGAFSICGQILLQMILHCSPLGLPHKSEEVIPGSFPVPPQQTSCE